MPENVALVTEDGQTLEAELTPAAEEHALAVLCHPHPQYGGDMRSLVTSELFGALPGAGHLLPAVQLPRRRAAAPAPTTAGTPSSSTCTPR